MVMLSILENIIEQTGILKERKIIGVLLFGSIVKKKFSKFSDIDIAGIYNLPQSSLRLREIKLLNNYRLDIHRYSYIFFENALRNKYNAFSRSFWIEILRNSIIIYNKSKKLERLKALASSWEWKNYEVTGITLKAFSSLKSAEKQCYNSMLCYKKLIQGVLMYMNSRFMEKNLPLSLNLKYYYSNIPHLSKDERELFSEICTLRDSCIKSANELNKILSREPKIKDLLKSKSEHSKENLKYLIDTFRNIVHS